MESRWIAWVRRLQAIAQNGLAFSKGPLTANDGRPIIKGTCLSVCHIAHLYKTGDSE
jgi:Hydrolase of X-linked nucleoside diphosphate N terminal